MPCELAPPGGVAKSHAVAFASSGEVVELPPDVGSEPEESVPAVSHPPRKRIRRAVAAAPPAACVAVPDAIAVAAVPAAAPVSVPDAIVVVDAPAAASVAVPVVAESSAPKLAKAAICSASCTWVCLGQ